MNNSSEACLVVSTQVVEVSLDISFDLMITECASLDALIQRFGRINRKRTYQAKREYKPIYVIQPPKDNKDALPYDLEVLQRSYAVRNIRYFENLPEFPILNVQYIQTLYISLDPIHKYKPQNQYPNCPTKLISAGDLIRRFSIFPLGI